MSYENVKLWFAKDEDGNIVTIDKIDETALRNNYYCPMCGSDLIIKATKSKKVTPHFAHIDASKCNSETMIHWWFKHKFLEKGEKFTVVSDKKKHYTVKDLFVEQEYKVGDKIYNPDVTVITEDNETIYFEMAFSNKKKVKDYLDIWLELKNIVVEVDIKQLMFKNELPEFKALFYNGKCFNIKKNDTYYNTIGKYKEEKFKEKITPSLKERIQKLDWFWEEVFRYKNGERDIEYMVNLIDSIDWKDRYIVDLILKKSVCSDLYANYLDFKSLDNVICFEEILSKDHSIRKAIKILNKKYKDIDKNYKVVLYKHSIYEHDTYWFRGQKRKKSRVAGYHYSFFLTHKLVEGWSIKQTYVTKRIMRMNDINEIVNFVLQSFNGHSILMKCKDCGEHYRINDKEIMFYSQNKLNYPLRCKACKQKRKNKVR